MKIEKGNQDLGLPLAASGSTLPSQIYLKEQVITLSIDYQ